MLLERESTHSYSPFAFVFAFICSLDAFLFLFIKILYLFCLICFKLCFFPLKQPIYKSGMSLFIRILYCFIYSLFEPCFLSFYLFWSSLFIRAWFHGLRLFLSSCAILRQLKPQLKLLDIAKSVFPMYLAS